MERQHKPLTEPYQMSPEWRADILARSGIDPADYPPGPREFCRPGGFLPGQAGVAIWEATWEQVCAGTVAPMRDIRNGQRVRRSLVAEG